MTLSTTLTSIGSSSFYFFFDLSVLFLIWFGTNQPPIGIKMPVHSHFQLLDTNSITPPFTGSWIIARASIEITSPTLQSISLARAEDMRTLEPSIARIPKALYATAFTVSRQVTLRALYSPDHPMLSSCIALRPISNSFDSSMTPTRARIGRSNVPQFWPNSDVTLGWARRPCRSTNPASQIHKPTKPVTMALLHCLGANMTL